ncbi:hypothetical protein [Kitasatospora sp. NPDC098663]|uniref:hypothetical protein n=1 Tax=Kitasatospora sp. NPDC098663 TaxID=3364096 RepID=UPI0037F51F2F
MYLKQLPDAILHVLDASPDPMRWNDVETLLEYDGPYRAPQFYDVMWKMYGLKDGETAYVDQVSTEVDPEGLHNPLLTLTEAGVAYIKQQRTARRDLVAVGEAEWDTTREWPEVVFENRQHKEDYTELVIYLHGGHMNNPSGTYVMWKRGERLMRKHFPEGSLRDIWGWHHQVDPDEADVLEAAALWGPVGMVLYDRK